MVGSCKILIFVTFLKIKFISDVKKMENWLL